MKATRFEFRWRFFIIGVIFWICFFWSGQSSHGHLGYLWIQLAAWMSQADKLSNDTNSTILKIAVSGFVVIAAILRTWAAAYLHSSVVHDDRVHADRVVSVGPYAYLRNPLYLATILLTLALAPMNSPWPALVLVVVMVLFMLRLIAREEADLTAIQGESYLRYKRTVPSLLPLGRRGEVMATPLQAQWGQAILGELWFWGFAAAVIAYAFTFSMLWLARISLVGLGLYFIMRGVMKKRVS